MYAAFESDQVPSGSSFLLRCTLAAEGCQGTSVGNDLVPTQVLGNISDTGLIVEGTVTNVPIAVNYSCYIIEIASNITIGNIVANTTVCYPAKPAPGSFTILYQGEPVAASATDVPDTPHDQDEEDDDVEDDDDEDDNDDDEDDNDDDEDDNDDEDNDDDGNGEDDEDDVEDDENNDEDDQ